MSAEFVHRRLVEFSETDMAGIVHFANFLRWMESAEHAFLRSLGHSVHPASREQASGWPRVKVGCEYRSPLRFEQEVEVILRVEEVRNRSVRYRFTVRAVGAEEPAALGEVVAVYAVVDVLEGGLRAAPIPPGLRERLLAWVSNADRISSEVDR
jgi:acyl-CoA thioester hydrolase